MFTRISFTWPSQLDLLFNTPIHFGKCWESMSCSWLWKPQLHPGAPNISRQLLGHTATSAACSALAELQWNLTLSLHQLFEGSAGQRSRNTCSGSHSTLIIQHQQQQLQFSEAGWVPQGGAYGLLMPGHVPQQQPWLNWRQAKVEGLQKQLWAHVDVTCDPTQVGLCDSKVPELCAHQVVAPSLTHHTLCSRSPKKREDAQPAPGAAACKPGHRKGISSICSMQIPSHALPSQALLQHFAWLEHTAFTQARACQLNVRRVHSGELKQSLQMRIVD